MIFVGYFEHGIIILIIWGRISFKQRMWFERMLFEWKPWIWRIKRCRNFLFWIFYCCTLSRRMESAEGKSCSGGEETEIICRCIGGCGWVGDADDAVEESMHSRHPINATLSRSEAEKMSPILRRAREYSDKWVKRRMCGVEERKDWRKHRRWYCVGVTGRVRALGLVCV